MPPLETPPPILADYLELGYELSAHCAQPRCGHVAPLDLARLADRWGRDLPVPSLKALLRCTRCGAKGAGVTVAPKVQPGMDGYGSRS